MTSRRGSSRLAPRERSASSDAGQPPMLRQRLGRSRVMPFASLFRPWVRPTPHRTRWSSSPRRASASTSTRSLLPRCRHARERR